MRTRRGFARFALGLAAGLLVGTGLTIGVTLASFRAVPLPACVLDRQNPWSDDEAYHEGELHDVITRVRLQLVAFEGQRPAFLAQSAVTDLYVCSFRGADLSSMDLSRCHFWECDLVGARLDGANLNGATYDRRTRWPARFDPQRAGARLVE